MFYLFHLRFHCSHPFLFIVFVVFGGFLAFKRPKVAWFHIPAVIWGGVVELLNMICPLTRLENLFRFESRRTHLAGDFIQNHLFPILYPEILTREIQIILGIAVLTGNLILYVFVFRNKARWKQFLQ
jgi:hypothetical protein